MLALIYILRAICILLAIVAAYCVYCIVDMMVRTDTYTKFNILKVIKKRIKVKKAKQTAFKIFFITTAVSLLGSAILGILSIALESLNDTMVMTVSNYNSLEYKEKNTEKIEKQELNKEISASIQYTDQSGTVGTTSGNNSSGSFSKNAEGRYAVTLDDGSYYWYHQSSAGCGCSNCGASGFDWSDIYWQNGGRLESFASQGCAVYSLAIAVSNLCGKEITPFNILEDLGCTFTYDRGIPTFCDTSTSLAFSGIMILREKAVKIIAEKYDLKYGKVDGTKASIDEALSKGSYIWGRWQGSFTWYSGGHFMVIRAGDDTSYKCFSSCSNAKLFGGGKDGAIKTMSHSTNKDDVLSCVDGAFFYLYNENKTSNNKKITVEQIMNDPLYTKFTNSVFKHKAFVLTATYYTVMNENWSQNFAAGLMANVCSEGNFGFLEARNRAGYWNYASPVILEMAGGELNTLDDVYTWLNQTPRKSGFGVGMVQWSYPTRRDSILKAYINHAVTNNKTTFDLQDKMDIETQYVIQEFKTGYADITIECLENSYSAYDCAALICREYERPADMVGAPARRGAQAQQILAIIQGE